MTRLAIVATHPIQYNAPWFQLLTQRQKIELKVFYTWSQSKSGPKYDPDFKQLIEWDIPLLEGYSFEFVENVSKTPGSHHFNGINNPSLIRIIKSWHPDAILIIGWANRSHLACMYYFKGRIPVLFRGDSTLLDEVKGVKTLLRRLFLRLVYRHIDIALYVGTQNKKYFVAHGLKEKQLLQAWHAIDNERFSNRSSFKDLALENLKKKLGIKPNHFVVLFAGKLEVKKNPFFLLEIAKKIKEPDVIFLLVGNGHLEKELKFQSANDSRIKFLDFQNQSMMPTVYALANVFILPSKGPGETWGLAINEAMASGVPVIASSKAGGAIDLVKGNGIIHSLRELERVQTYIEYLKNYPEQYKKATEASLTHIKNFNFAQIAEAVEKACTL